MELNQGLGVSINIEESLGIPLPVYSSNTIDNPDKSVRKKFKTNHYPNKEIRSVESSNVQQSFEMAQIYQNHGQSLNMDIQNPIFRLPFEHGWKREVVFRKIIDSSVSKQFKQPFADVYYLTPTNKKLRSLREVRKYLNRSQTKDNILTIENFTFTKKATGINDKSKEIIRKAHKSSKDNFRPNRSKEQKNTYKKQPNNTKKDNKSKNTSLNPTSKKKLIIHSSTTSSTSSSQTVKKNILNNNKRNLKINNSLRKKSNPSMITMQAHSNMMIVLKLVFKQFNVYELLTASKVCIGWKIIAMNDALWQNVCLKNLKVYNWEKCINTVDLRKSFSLDTSHMFIPKQIHENKKFWSYFAKAIKIAKNIKTIVLYECPINVVEVVMYSLPQLEVLKATINNNQFKYQINDSMTLGYLEQMAQLTEIRLKGPVAGIKLMPTPSLSNLTNLKILSLTSINSFPRGICSSLLNLKKHLEVLKIGNCDSLPENFPSVIEKLEKLISLRLENCNGKWDSYGKYYFRAIRRLNNLRILELINIKFSYSIEYELKNCDHIKALLIIPDYINQSSAINFHLFHHLKKLSKTLSHLVWGITNETLDDCTDLFNSYIKNMYKSYILMLSSANKDFNNIPEGETIFQPEETTLETNEEIPSQDFNLLKVKGLEDLLKKHFASVKIKLINIPFSATTEIYLANEFNDID